MPKTFLPEAFVVRVLTLLLALFALTSPVYASAVAIPMTVELSSPKIVAGATVYRVKVRSSGSPLFALFPPDIRLVELRVNGAVVQREGWNVPVGQPPFGAGLAVIHLQNLHPRDHVELRIRGGSERPHIIADTSDLRSVFGSGFWSGIFFAILGTVALFQLTTAIVLRDRTVLWYVPYILALLGSECALDGYFPGGTVMNDLVLNGFEILGSVSLVGFMISYLRIRSRFVPSIWIATLVVNVIPSLIFAAVAFVHQQPESTLVATAPCFVGLIGFLGLSVYRSRTGYAPANYLILGLLGLATVLAAKMLREQWGAIPLPLLDRWGVQAGAAFDVVVFSLGLSYRARFRLHERTVMENQLSAEAYRATHDPLTGLLNRRGLDEWTESVQSPLATVLFIDLDGFKSVNDQGGHAAGDDTLSVIARILRHAVRSQDAIARVGGDEFVIVLADCVDPSERNDIVSRITTAIENLRPLGARNDTRIGASIGIGTFDGTNTFAEATKVADADAYRVKAEHRATRRAGRVETLHP